MRCKIVLLILITTVIQAQNQKAFELGVQLDNDSFTSLYNDFYYTNGTFVFANYLSRKSTAATKIIRGFKIGQQIYNPRWVKSDFPEDHNRPYAGYLYGEYSVTKRYASNAVLGMSFQLGIVGPDSQAEEFQKGLHSSFGFGEIIGWEYQIKNTVAIQYGILYSKPIFTKATTPKIDCHLYSESTVGTAFTGTNIGILSRVSLSKSLTAMHDSNFYKGLGTAKKELYFFILPKINLQLYDATIQGSLFNKDSPVTFSLKPLRFKAEAGFKWKYNRFNLSYVFNYTTDEIKNSSATGFYYGAITSSYGF